MKIENTNGYLIYNIDDEDGYNYVIEQLEADEQSAGAQLMKQIIKIADNEGKNLSLCAYPDNDSISLENLIEFYETFGFEVEHDTGDYAIMSKKQNDINFKGYYAYEKIRDRALSYGASFTEKEALADWFDNFKPDAWNGEEYVISERCMSMRPIYESKNQDEFEIINYEVLY